MSSYRGLSAFPLVRGLIGGHSPTGLTSGERGSSSLVSIPPNAPTIATSQTEGCPRTRGYVWANLETGEVRPARCGRNGCLWCGPINAVILAGAIDVAGPQRLLTLTKVGDSWAEVRPRMFKLGYEIRRAWGQSEWCWHVEPNPKGTGHHVHALQWGASFIPQRWLSAAARRRGMGKVVDIRPVRAQDRVGFYGLKMAAAAYTLKLAREEESYRTYQRVNGGRQLAHASRGFWRDRDGLELAGVKAARAEALKEAFGIPNGNWVRVSHHRLGQMNRGSAITTTASRFRSSSATG